MSDWITDLETVVKLIVDLEPEDLSAAERRAVLRLAHHVDRDLNRQTSSNKHANRTFEQPSRLAKTLGCMVKDCKVCNKIPDRTVPDLDGKRIELGGVWRT